MFITEKVLRCRDIGSDCDFVIHAKTEEEIFKKASDHAKKAHHLNEVPKELMEKAQAAIYEEDERARSFIRG